MSGWRLIEDEAPRPGAENMAVDQALLESVQTGGLPVLRFYRWDPSCLSLGRNERAHGKYEPAAAAALGVDIVRRPTGGRAVHHDRELTYAVAVPLGLVGLPRETYGAINRALVAGLRRLGIAASLAGSAAPRRQGLAAGPCFGSAAPGEVVVDTRKLVGSAQLRERRTLLQHGSLLFEGDQSMVRRLMRAPVATNAAGQGPRTGSAPRPATLASVLGSVPAWSELVSALAAGFEEVLGIALAQAALSYAERGQAVQRSARYRSAAWTWRR